MASKDLTDSDTSDEEYVPGGVDEGPVSEEESDGDPEEGIENNEDNHSKKTKTKNKTKRKSRNSKKNTEIEDEVDEIEPEKSQLTEEEQKKKVDSLWADFLKDTDFKPKPTTISSQERRETVLPKVKPKPTKEVKKMFEFAGEILEMSPSNPGQVKPESSTTTLPMSKPLPFKRSSAGGMSSVLNSISKKQKITTLEKSKLDWDRFKKDENIEDELKSFNKGKNGYLERQDFLERADMRRFEIEKQLRANNKNHRSS